MFLIYFCLVHIIMFQSGYQKAVDYLPIKDCELSKHNSDLTCSDLLVSVWLHYICYLFKQHHALIGNKFWKYIWQPTAVFIHYLYIQCSKFQIYNKTAV